jgi:hypothetical protein
MRLPLPYTISYVFSLPFPFIAQLRRESIGRSRRAITFRGSDGDMYPISENVHGARSWEVSKYYLGRKRGRMDSSLELWG